MLASLINLQSSLQRSVGHALGHARGVTVLQTLGLGPENLN